MAASKALLHSFSRNPILVRAATASGVAWDLLGAATGAGIGGTTGVVTGTGAVAGVFDDVGAGTATGAEGCDSPTGFGYKKFK